MSNSAIMVLEEVRGVDGGGEEEEEDGCAGGYVGANGEWFSRGFLRGLWDGVERLEVACGWETFFVSPDPRRWDFTFGRPEGRRPAAASSPFNAEVIGGMCRDIVRMGNRSPSWYLHP